MMLLEGRCWIIISQIPHLLPLPLPCQRNFPDWNISRMVCSSVFWLFVLEVNRTFWRGSGWKGSCVWGLSGFWILTNTDGLFKKKSFLDLYMCDLLPEQQPKFSLDLWAQKILVRLPWLYDVFEEGAPPLSLGYDSLLCEKPHYI